MNETAKLGITLMVVTLIASLALALTNYYTAEKIVEQKDIAIRESLQKVIDADNFEEKDGYYEAYKEEQLIGKVLKVEAQGYSSIISALVGVDLDNKITGVDIVSQEETPGLGANIEKPEFLSQFQDKGAEDMLLKKDGGEIDAVTGATISSRAITDGIKGSLEENEKE